MSISRKKIIIPGALKTLVFVCCAGLLLEGCSGMPAAGGTKRNKMPEFADLSNGFESSGNGFQKSNTGTYSQFGLTFNDVAIDFMGSRESCVSVNLPSAADDSVAFSLIHTYGRFALPLLSNWARREHNGVVLDFRDGVSPGAVVHKAQYLVGAGNDPEIPVIFLWDSPSAARASGYISMLGDFTGIKYRLLSGK